MGRRRFKDGAIVTFHIRTMQYNYVAGLGTVVGYRDGKYILLAGFPSIGLDRFRRDVYSFNLMVKVSVKHLLENSFVSLSNEIYYRSVPRQWYRGYGTVDIPEPSPKTRVSYFLSHFKSELNPNVETIEIGV